MSLRGALELIQSFGEEEKTAVALVLDELGENGYLEADDVVAALEPGATVARCDKCSQLSVVDAAGAVNRCKGGCAA